MSNLKGFTSVSLLFVLCGFALHLTGLNAHAEPVQWEGNGHWYDVIDFPSTWVDAFKDARKRTYQSLRGHLLTLTSQEESDFVWQTFHRNAFWLGAFQVPWARKVDKGWKWVTREPWGFTNWKFNEPNDCCETLWVEDGEENFAHFDTTEGEWNDNSGTYGALGYIIEYEPRDASASAPPIKVTATHPQRKLTTTWADLKRAR